MEERLRPKLTYANVMSTIAVVVAVAGGAWAVGAVPDDSGRISACYVPQNVTKVVRVGNRRVRRVVKRKGQFRLLVTGTRCLRDERKLTWNQRGPSGAAGAPGAPGVPGSPAASMLTGVGPSSQLLPGAGASTELTPVGVATAGAATLSPSIPVVLRDLSAELSTAPGLGASRTIALGVGDTAFPSPAISCTISGMQTKCDTGTQTVTVPANTKFALSVQNGPGTPPQSAAVWFGYRATTP